MFIVLIALINIDEEKTIGISIVVAEQAEKRSETNRLRRNVVYNRERRMNRNAGGKKNVGEEGEETTEFNLCFILVRIRFE